MAKTIDLLVIGGGVNGCGIAVDAAGRGLDVTLCEMGDLASATSSNSSKLIHGGLRYLEHYEFRLVRKALKEREVLLKKAPHIIWPLRFQMPHMPHLRPAWMIRLGLFLYDNLARRARLKNSQSIDFSSDGPLVASITKGFEYSDCWVDDARLVTLNAVQARDLGADIRVRTKCISLKRDSALWRVELKNLVTGEVTALRARTVVNAAGPWVQNLFEEQMEEPAPHKIRLVKGSHIIVPRLYEGEQCFILQNEDRRIVFTIPYERDFTLIGTTDVEIQGDPNQAVMDDYEKGYLIKLINGYFKKNIHENDIVHHYSGVRALLDDEKTDPSKVTRDYVLVSSGGGSEPGLISVFGGKITTYRVLADAVMEKLKSFFPDLAPPWTHNAPLPGGGFESPKTLLNELMRLNPWLPEGVVKRYVRSYGTLAWTFLDGVKSWHEMGEDFGCGLTAKEVDYLRTCEFAQTAEDIIWRRSKLGLVFAEEGVGRLRSYLETNIK